MKNRTLSLPIFSFVMFVAPLYCQELLSSPVSPVFPTSMTQCNQLQADYGKYQSKLTSEHSACLNAHKAAKSGPARNEPAGVCSVPACQSLHNRMYTASSTGGVAVSECRQKVQKLLDDQARKKEELDRALEHAKEDQRQAEDNARRKTSGDQQESLRASQEAIARKQAEADDAWRVKQAKLLADQKRARDEAAAKFRKEQADRDRRLGLDHYADKHAAWQAREAQRRKEIAQLEDAATKIEDENQRHAALDRAIKQIQEIKEQRKQDPEPK